ncbi:Glutamate receptor 2.7 [Morus notabilis]|uniref:Glutamate receptor n=1 Tax=Morus notabilis TaxID=981085 RepID=W9SE49_9ROSA|nr:glutamate receptor 2.7 [Morus notabilis]XP_010101736.1 glutamate receptor 2.7 [Morus notabilis]XP_010101739.1 glutamate receptor 2.7 [Morus notabilis]EXB89491.1 Glutamate receptor 2.7 [Morus notabilis]EXB89494.1 Glutamate receptor 2.7 [Morus notabilis]EXC38213.1 Glutamate receptor 2.7 [Morus notabilis]
MNRLIFFFPSISLFVFLGLIPIIFLSDLAIAQNRIEVNKVKVGVVVDYNDKLFGRMGLRCIKMALSDFYASRSHYNTRLALQTRDSDSDVVEAASAALDLIKNVQVQAIIGPITSMQANFIVDLGEKARVPIISYSATSPSLNIRSSYFFQATQNEASQVKAISSLVKAFGWKQVIPIYTNDDYGEGLIPFLTDALLEVDAHISYRSVVSNGDEKELDEELKKLMTMQTRVFILHTNVSLGTRTFAKAREIGMMGEGYVWIVTNGMTNLLSSIEPSVVGTMSGVLGIKTYVPETKGLKNFRDKWKTRFEGDKLNVFGLWAYDAAKALAIAVEYVGKSGKFGFRKGQKVEGNYSTDLDAFGVSQNGTQLHEALSNVTFKGLAGDFRIVKGQLHSSTYEIINIANVNGEIKRVGFWTPRNGLAKSLSSTKKLSKEYNTSKDNLGNITWPGGSKSDPKGWEIPTNGKKLKVGVPLRGGFTEFVRVTNNADNTPNVTGYCIDIFKAVMEELPYKVDYEFIPFVNSSGGSNGTYDDMVYQVYLKNFDAAVGDTTIRANRSLYVDFTLPYTESGVSMIVPVKDKVNKNAWVFLKPLTWDLWVTIACFFVFIGFVVWILEHRINEEFRGPPSHQIGTSFWFSFSTMVFAHRERVISNLARFVITIWVFVVLILTQSYTASLTSLLTSQQLQATVTNVSQLIKNGDNVGYLEGSFVYGMLKGLGFNDSRLKVFKSPKELHEKFSNYPSAHDGIAAAFDETPYVKLFLRKYCSKYTLADPTFKADGFGFVFPRGSPLVPDVSRAILNVTEGEKLKKIEAKYFGTKTSCPDPSSTQGSSNSSLGLESFWGLFLIAGVSSLCALAINVVIFFHGQRDVIVSSTPAEASMWKRFHVICKVFDQKDLSSHTFRKSSTQAAHGQTNGNVHGVVPLEAISNTNSHPISPSSYSDHTDFNFVVFSEQESSPAHHGNSDQSSSATDQFSDAQNHEARGTNSS